MAESLRVLRGRDRPIMYCLISFRFQPLPERPPRVGELVELRSRGWLVEAVEDVAPPASPRVSLACADHDARRQAQEVYRDFEIDRRILEQEAWSAIGARGFDAPRFFSAFLHTLRWNCVTATDPDLFQSPFRAGSRIDAWQMEPLRKALRLPRVNLFIADGTGLGKTIEAGLVAQEPLLRKKAKSVVVAARAAGCEGGRSRRIHEAVDFAGFPLGVCRGARPWLGRHANEESREPSRLLIRTASDAWFPQVVGVLSLPDRGSEVDQAVEGPWDRLQVVKDANALGVTKSFPDVANGLASFSDREVPDAIAARSSGGVSGERPSST